MPFSRVDRKTALLRSGVTQVQIAEACEVDITLVCHVMAGRRWTSPGSLKVMRYVAEKFGAPVSEVFPGVDREVAHSA